MSNDVYVLSWVDYSTHIILGVYQSYTIATEEQARYIAYSPREENDTWYLTISTFDLDARLRL